MGCRRTNGHCTIMCCCRDAAASCLPHKAWAYRFGFSVGNSSRMCSVGPRGIAGVFVTLLLKRVNGLQDVMKVSVGVLWSCVYPMSPRSAVAARCYCTRSALPHRSTSAKHPRCECQAFNPAGWLSTTRDVRPDRRAPWSAPRPRRGSRRSRAAASRARPPRASPDPAVSSITGFAHGVVGGGDAHSATGRCPIGVAELFEQVRLSPASSNL